MDEEVIIRHSQGQPNPHSEKELVEVVKQIIPSLYVANVAFRSFLSQTRVDYPKAGAGYHSDGK